MLGITHRLAHPRAIATEKGGTRVYQTAIGTQGPVGYVEDVHGQRSPEALLGSHFAQMDHDFQPVLPVYVLNPDGTLPVAAVADLSPIAEGELNAMRSDVQAALDQANEAWEKAMAAIGKTPVRLLADLEQRIRALRAEIERLNRLA